MREWNATTRPILSVTIRPKTACEHEQLSRVQIDLVQKFPWMNIKIEVSDGQIFLSGMSEFELDIVSSGVQLELKTPLEVGEFQVLYLESIRHQAEAEGKYIRQTGGAGNYGHCKIRLTPTEPGTEVQFISEIENNAIPEQFLAPIEAGIRETLEAGILSGHPLVDVTATLFDGSFHEQDSNEIAYKIAASNATREALRKANPFILEPVMRAEIVAPENFAGIVVSDISNRRGRVDHIERHAFSQVIVALVPMAESLGYAKELLSLTKGEATYTDQFAFYQPAPHNPGSSGVQGGVTANKPSGPKPKINRAAAELDDNFDSL
jgi:elongation factor G